MITPIHNMGVPKKNSPQFSLDWLRFSTPNLEEFRRFMAHFSDILQGEIATVEQPFPFYDTAYRMRFGRADWNTKRVEQGLLFTLTGKDLVSWLNAGGNHQELVNYVNRLPHLNVSRLDFAVDIFIDDISPNDIYEAMEAGAIRTGAKNFSRVESKINGGQMGVTVYIGSRASMRLLRVYDKAVQAGANYPWVRIEIELKKEFARLVLRQMADIGIVKAGKAAIRDFVTTNIDWFDNAVVGPNVDYLTPGARKDTEWEKWIKAVVLPNAVRAIAADVSGFREAMRAALDNAEKSDEHGK